MIWQKKKNHNIKLKKNKLQGSMHNKYYFYFFKYIYAAKQKEKR